MLVAVEGGTTVAVTVPNFTVFRLDVVLNPVPLMVIVLPLMPDAGERLLIPITVKGFALLSTPLAWTTTFPVEEPVGTVAFMLPAAQVTIEAVTPLNLTEPLP
jgi:hypothetical protein